MSVVSQAEAMNEETSAPLSGGRRRPAEQSVTGEAGQSSPPPATEQPPTTERMAFDPAATVPETYEAPFASIPPMPLPSPSQRITMPSAGAQIPLPAPSVATLVEGEVAGRRQSAPMGAASAVGGE